MWKIGNWLSNQKFGIRLALGFSTIGVLMLFMGAFSVNGAFTLSAVTENLHRHPYTVSNATRDVQTAIYAIHRDMKDIALSRDPSEIETAMASINQHEKNALEAFDIIEKRFLGDKTDIEEAKKAFLSWKPFGIAPSIARATGIMKAQRASPVKPTPHSCRHCFPRLMRWWPSHQTRASSSWNRPTVRVQKPYGRSPFLFLPHLLPERLSRSSPRKISHTPSIACAK